MHVTLQKRDIGQTWSSPIMGEGQLDPLASDLEQKRLMLQRFQEEVIWLSSTKIYVAVLAFSYLLGVPRWLFLLKCSPQLLLPSCWFVLIHWTANYYLLVCCSFIGWFVDLPLLGGLVILMNSLTLSNYCYFISWLCRHWHSSWTWDIWCFSLKWLRCRLGS